MIKPVSAADFQALQLLVITINHHVCRTSPEFRLLCEAVNQHMVEGKIPLVGIPPELADHAVGEFQESWKFLFDRAMPPK